MRHGSTLRLVFERFTERARQVVVLAQDEARSLKHNYIGTEHILLGLLREKEGVAARVLESFGVTLEEARARVGRIHGQGDEEVTGQIPFTPRATKTLEFAQREALSLGHNYIGTEHILLGLLRENESVAFRILLDFDVYADETREEVIRMFAGPGRLQAGEDVPRREEVWVSELGLRRVVPVAQQMSDGAWIVSVEIWDHGLVIRWATSQRPPQGLGHLEDLSWWVVSDDVGTSYRRWGGGRDGHPRRGLRYDAEFEPAPPSEATELRIRPEGTGEEFSVSLTD
jgi:hypothetical protein